MYDNIGIGKRYDVVFWNHPWIPKEDTYDLKTREILEYGLFDPGYKFLKRFISQAEDHLKPDGVIYIGFGDFGDLDALKSICTANGYKIGIVGEQLGQENGEVNFELYKIYR